MGLLDNLPDTDATTRAIELIGPALERFMGEADERTRSLFELIGEGLSPANIIGLKKPHLDALLAQGIRMIQFGDLDKARDILTILSALEPTDGRAAYSLGVIAYQQGHLEAAARLFLQFAALDATNPDGHLRLGECLLANGELDNAEECFDRARALAAAGHGDARQIAYAKRMLAVVADRRRPSA